MGSSLSLTVPAITDTNATYCSTRNTMEMVLEHQQQQSEEDYVRLEQEQVLENQLTGYYQSLEKSNLAENSVEASFKSVAQSSIINIMGIKQRESYEKHKSFTPTDFTIMRSLHKLTHFSHDTHSEVKHLIDPLKKAFQKDKLIEVDKAIKYMKNIQAYKGCSFTTIDYQLLDILEYITELCLKKQHNSSSNSSSSDKDPSNAACCLHWSNILDMLFRGTNVKISKRKSRFDQKEKKTRSNPINNKSTTTAKTNGKNNNEIENEEEEDNKMETIIFQCISQNTFGQLDTIEISTCNISSVVVEKNKDDKEAIFESQSILTSKSILDCLVNDYNHDNNVDKVNFFPICVQLIGYNGYLYSIRKYKGAYIASKVCDDILFIPLATDEFQTFLFEGHVLEMLCNLKRHYVGISKIVRHVSATKNSSWITNV